ncbi:YfhO family protein [Candidatus Woesearchaeota archaeon]|nr:YfhO family protein [Candidatus Woesearchaeota archaeon]
MELSTILLFFVYAWGFGFILSWFDKSKNIYEKNIMRLGYGLAFMGFLFALFSLLKIPIDWRIFLVLAVLGPLVHVLRTGKYKDIRSGLKARMPSLNILLLLVIFGVSLNMYLSGAFSYPYLEDDDPWSHASGAKYISIEKTAYESVEDNFFLYIDARPPNYDGIMGLLLQTSEKISDVLKTFNSMFICLGLLFFYFFAKQVMGSANKALFATAVLAMLPAYFTHFIWSHTLVIALFFPALYAFNRIEKDRLWIIPAAFSIAGILLTQETQSIKFAVLIAGYFVIKTIVRKKIDWYQLAAPVAGFLLSLVWWLPMLVRYGSVRYMYKWGMQGYPLDYVSPEKYVHPSITEYWGMLGTATRQHGVYTLSDFFTITEKASMMNVSIAIGFVAMSLAVLGIIYLALKLRKTEKKREYCLFALFFFAFTYLGANGGMHWWSPFALFSFRFWLILAAAVALLAAEGAEMLKQFLKGNRMLQTGLVILLLLMVFYTSGDAKWEVNTGQWGPGGGWVNAEELQGYLALTQLPPDTKVFPFTSQRQGRAGERIIGLDKFFCRWCEEENDYSDWYDRDVENVYDFLKRNRYEYALFDSHIIEQEGVNESNELLQRYIDSGNFQAVFSNEGSVLLKVE